MSFLKKLQESLSDLQHRNTMRLLKEAEGFGRFHHVALDLETGSLESRAAIMSIGMVAFDIHTGEIGPTLQVNVDYEADLHSGGELSTETMQWWRMPQNQEAFESCTLDARSPEMALINVSSFLQTVLPDLPFQAHVWCLGSEFDPPIFNNFARRHGINRVRQGLPRSNDFIHRFELTDIRTVIRQFPKVPLYLPGVKVPHIAVEDAKLQADFLIRCARRGFGFMNPLRNLP